VSIATRKLDWGHYGFIAPALLSLLFWYYVPVVQSFAMAFFDWDGLSVGNFLGLDNFVEIFTDPVFWTALVNMVLVLAFSLTVPIFVPFLAAEGIQHLKSAKAREFFRTAMVLPVVVPAVVWILLWRNMYDPTNGLINRFVRAVFDPSFSQGWLSDPHTALGAILFIGFPFVSSTALLIFSAGLEEIPTDIYDAAQLEGLGFWERMRHIDLPFCIPHFRLILVSSFSAIIANYTAVLLLTQGRPLNSTLVPGYYLYRAGADQRFGLAAAVGLSLIVLILVLTVLLQKLLRSEVEHEAKR